MTQTQQPQMADDRPMRLSLLRGWRRKCPHCGNGPMFRGYLKLRKGCAVCGEDLSHARADDGPAYLTILVVGHLMAPVIHVVYTAYRPDPLTLAIGLSMACVALASFLLPRLKGAMVGFQWSRRLHGFGPSA